ncbi:MAG: phage terminase large subunit family protein, partial [Candidatus Scalindua sp.]
MIDLKDPRLNEMMMEADCVFWAVQNEIKLMGGTVFTLDGCEYMGDIMKDAARYLAVMKGAQARITTLFMLRAIHALINGKYPQGSIYYFPKKEAVENFSKTRFGPLIEDNYCIKKYLKNTNSVNIKRVGTAFLRLLGASSTSDIQGKKDSTSVRSEPADEAILDEFDLFDGAIADMIPDRLLNSKLKLMVWLGTPTIPDFGIHKKFNESDQKFRMVKCEHCNGYTCIAEEFPESVNYHRQTTHEKYRPYFACIKCKKEIFVKNGEYVAKFPDRYDKKYPMEGVSGYHVSHFITPNCELSLVMNRYEEAMIDGSKMGVFYNSMLGFPYIAIEDRLRQQDVFNCCGDELMASMSTVGTAMGADIMKTNRVVIAEKKKNGGARIIYMARVSTFDALYDLVGRFNVKSVVACLRPYEESFRKFQERCSNRDSTDKITVYGVEYRDKQRNLLKTDEESGIYVLARTEAMDGSQTWIRSGKLEIPRKCEEVNIFAKECTNVAKVLETNERTGDRIYRYRPVGVGGDHYRHCVNYLQLALLNLQDFQIGL